MTHLAQLIEAAFFAADRPLSLSELRALEPGTAKDDVLAAVEELRTRYDEYDHGVEVVEVADGFQVLTRAELAEAIQQARVVHRPRRLSPAALETLAIIAYRQPVGRADIEDIRGVAADGVLKSLQERDLIDVVGRGEGLGRPLLYGTTARFLEMLGLRDLTDLPRLEELSVALRPAVETFRGQAPAGRPLDELLREGVGGSGDEGGETEDEGPVGERDESAASASADAESAVSEAERAD